MQAVSQHSYCRLVVVVPVQFQVSSRVIYVSVRVYLGFFWQFSFPRTPHFSHLASGAGTRDDLLPECLGTESHPS
jgi:hypothetical protein